MTSIVLAVVMTLSLAGGLLCAWMHTTLFDSDALARRAVHALDSEAVRQQLAVQLTDQLVKSGNRGIIAFRPAAQLTVETLVDTDAFKSLFASAVRRTHSALLSGTADDGLDLSDSLGLLASGLSLNQDKKASAAAAASAITTDVGTTTEAGTTKPVKATMAEVVDRIAHLPVWDWQTELNVLGYVLFALAGLTAIGVVVVAYHRRLGLMRVGISAMVAGALVILVVIIGSRFAQAAVSSAPLRRAVEDTIWAATADLRAVALTLALVGAVVAAAASPHDRFDPVVARANAVARYRVLRVSTWGTLGLAAAAALAGLLMLVYPDSAISLLVWAIGLVLVFAATRMVVSLAAAVSAPVEGKPRRRWLGWVIGVAGLLLIAVPFSVVSVTKGHAAAENSYTRTCMGSEANCDLRLDEVTLAGSHNSMSAPAYPGWLFGEQIESIRGQLNAGVRALLIDPHYGRQSSVKVPSSGVQLVLTDFASEFVVPGAEVPDQSIRDRAAKLAASAPNNGKGKRDVYLCHNYCELGAVKMVDEMVAVRQFLETNPSEIVMIIVQDAVSAADVAQVFNAAGLLDQVATLAKGEPLPTLGDLVDAGTRLVVFAESGEDDAPAWYPRAYDWFQETPYAWKSIGSFTCAPNRGKPDNPLFLVNHWVGRSPPDPALSKQVNGRSVLEARAQQCLTDRGITPTVIAADVATSGDLIAVTSEMTNRHS